MKQKIYFHKYYIIVLLLSVFFGFAQQASPRLNQFMDSYSRLESEQKYDSINFLIARFSEIETLSPYEKTGFYLYKSIYYKRISRYDEAIVISKDGLHFCNNTPLFALFKKRLLINIADIYFTLQEFDQANQYAVKAKKIAIESYYDIDNYCITGYWFDINKQYKESIGEYEKALQLIKKYKNSCKSAQVLNKMANAYCKNGKYDKGIVLANKAISLADSCQELVNSINTRKSKYQILKEFKKYKEANEIYDTIILLDGKYAFNLRNEKLDELEAKFQNRLKTQKNAALKLINQQNKSVISRQRIILYCSVLVIVIFSFLVFFLIKFYRKQKETNEALESQKIQIEATNKELQRLNLLNQKIFSVISHDFKGPITTLKLLLSNETVKETENPVVASYIKEISYQLDQSDAMLESLLDWAKMELKVKESDKNPYAIDALVHEVIEQLKIKTIEKEITFLVSVDNQIQINFPQDVLKIVLRNIVNNAIKFSHAHGVIEISFIENRLIVKDYGKGIPANKLDKLFRQSINPGLGTLQESGFGIGLYLSYELMLKYQGSILVKNNKDNGCTFTIVLPH